MTKVDTPSIDAWRSTKRRRPDAQYKHSNSSKHNALLFEGSGEPRLSSRRLAEADPHNCPTAPQDGTREN